jgi:transcriptional regulator with XRE-family HTH domain
METRDRRLLFGQHVRQARQGQHLSQRKLADMIGSNQSYLWEVETGQVSVGFDIICRLSDALEVPEHILMDWRSPGFSIDYLPKDIDAQ